MIARLPRLFTTVSYTHLDVYKRQVYYSVEYATLTPVLVEAIKEQQKMIEELKAEIEQLKKNQAK